MYIAPVKDREGEPMKRNTLKESEQSSTMIPIPRRLTSHDVNSFPEEWS